MSRFSILSATCIAALSAWTFVAFATPASAHSYEYCRRDIIGCTLSCGFQQCPQAVAAIARAIPLSAMCAEPMHSHQSADKRSAF
jgi:hypothetical protein